MRMILWITAIAGYVIQTKCVSHIYSTTVYDDTDPVYLLFAHLSAWVLIFPLSQLYYYLRHGLLFSDQLRICGSIFSKTARPSDPELQLQVSHNHAKPPGDSVAARFAKLGALCVLVSVPMYTYFLSLSISPALDISIIHHTSIFEIVSLLIGVCGLASTRRLFSNFVAMVFTLLGILVVSYTNATSDLLSGKLSINASTGELEDPFLFDRLKGSLICGLGALLFGPFVVLWERWVMKRVRDQLRSLRLGEQDSERSATHKNLILNFEMSVLGLANILILGPILFLVCRNNPQRQTTGFKSSWTIVSILLGHLPYVLSLAQLSSVASPQYATTCSLGAIIMMSVVEWICQGAVTVMTRWQVVGYLVLSAGCLWLTWSYKPLKA